MTNRSTLYRILSIATALMFMLVVGLATTSAQDTTTEETPVEEVAVTDVEEMLTAEEVQSNLDAIWLLLAGFLVFLMQAGFAMLEGGFIRSTGVVNSMAENFMDAAVTGIMFFIVGYGIAYASTE